MLFVPPLSTVSLNADVVTGQDPESDCSIVHYTWNPQKRSHKLKLGLRNPPLTDTIVRTTSLPSNT